MKKEPWYNAIPLWLRVGLLFLLANGIFALLLWVPCFISFDSCEITGFGLMFTNLPFLIPAVEVFHLIDESSFMSEIIGATWVGLIGYFLAGCIIGAIMQWRKR